MDEDDNDPRRFWWGVAAALRIATPETNNAAIPLNAERSPALEPLLQSLLYELADSSADHVLVLDDYHTIQADPIQRGLTYLLDRLPENLHLVIASRAEAPLPLARLRARGQLVELVATDLRFTGDEAAAFFHTVMDLRLTSDQVERLEAVTEGWPAGLQLAGLAMQGHADPAAFVETFTGTHRFILDYLMDEVLRQQPDEVQRFLGQTAILDRLAGPLCEAVMGYADAQLMLERIERANLFVVPLDDERRWYRYHRLFAEALRGRSTELDSGDVRELHRRASAWFAQNGFTGDAIRHALAAGNPIDAGLLVEQAAQGLLRRGEVATVQRWMDSLPSDIVRSRPRLVLTQAWTLVAAGHAEQAAAILEDAETFFDRHAGQSEPERAAFRGEAAALRAHAATRKHDWHRAIVLSQQALAQMPDDNPTLRALAALNLGTAQRHVGDPESALQAFARAGSVAEASGDLLLVLYAAAFGADIHAARGQLRRAARTYERAFELSNDHRGRQLPVSGMAHVGLGKVFREWSRLDDARRHLEAGIALARRGGLEGIVVDGSITLALVEQACADFDAAHELLNNADRIVRSWHDLANTGRVAAFEARVHLAEGRYEEAVRWATEADLPPITGEPDIALEIEYTTLVRVLVAQARADPAGPWLAQARSVLGQLLPAAEAEGRTGATIEILTLESLAADAVHDRESALVTLTRALALAESEGYVRTFVDEGVPMASLLEDVLEGRRRGSIRTPHPAPEYLEHVLAAFGAQRSSTNERPRPSGSQWLAEPLSERELDVLRLIVAGASNREIAGSFVVGVSTVKTHVNRIFRKLDVTTRTQAIARAHALRLVD